jgi:REP element-mobilizing transposase RayT
MKKRKIIRLKGYDYSQKGYYFVTIEPFDRKYPFCEIINGKTHLNEIGKIIDDQWKWLFEQYDYIRMDEYVIMPDHFHGIIRILPDSQENVRATRESPVHSENCKKLSLSRIIGAFKTTSSKLIHQAGYKNFKWKRSFHDRIIRDDELEIKKKYIKNNPQKYQESEHKEINGTE